MATGLNLARVINGTINLSPKAAVYRNFGALLILGSSTVIDTVERIREFDGLDSIVAQFGTTAPESLAATNFFSQQPQPSLCYVGRWAQVPTSGLLHGAILVPSQQLLTNFTAVTSGGMFVLVDGVPYALTGLNFSSATNLNGVASILQASLQAAGAAGARVLWGAINQRFDVISGTTGSPSSVSYVAAPTARTSVVFSAQPAANATLTLNGSAVTFVAASPSGNQVLIGANLAVTLANLAQAINTSIDAQVSKFSAFATATALYLWADLPGSAGNALTVASSTSPASAGVVSASPMTGATGTDVSVLLGLSILPTIIGSGTGSNASPPVQGAAAETLLSAVSLLADMSGLWYGLSVATATPPADADYLATSAFIEGTTQPRIHGITSQNTAIIDPTRSDDIASVLKSLNYSRTVTQYSSTSPYAVVSALGRIFTVNYDGSNTTITLKFKQEPGVIAESLRASQADALEAKNANVFVNYNNATSIFEQGVMANGYFVDERITADWMLNALIVDLYNILYQSATKVPQTDDGQNLLITQCNHTAQRAVTNGWVAPGIWNADGFGALKQGDLLKTGYYFWSDTYADQSQADREARKSMPIQGALKLAGAIHSVDLAVLVNR